MKALKILAPKLDNDHINKITLRLIFKMFMSSRGDQTKFLAILNGKINKEALDHAKPKVEDVNLQDRIYHVDCGKDVKYNGVIRQKSRDPEPIYSMQSVSIGGMSIDGISYADTEYKHVVTIPRGSYVTETDDALLISNTPINENSESGWDEQKLTIVGPYEFTLPNMKGRALSINGKAYDDDTIQWLFGPRDNGTETDMTMELLGYSMNIKNGRHIKFIGLKRSKHINVIVTDTSIDFTFTRLAEYLHSIHLPLDNKDDKHLHTIYSGSITIGSLFFKDNNINKQKN